jgi:hypothetical protein
MLLALILAATSTNQFPFAKGVAVQGIQWDGGNVQAYGVICGTNVSCSGADFGWVTISATLDGGASGGGAPTGAQYWTGAADGTLSAEKNLGALSTGLVINTSGVPSAYAGTSCTNQFPRSLNASGSATCASVSLTADVTGTLAQGSGGTGAGALTCSSGQALTSNGSAYSCTATLTASDVACAGTCVADGEIAGVSGSKVSGAVATATALAADPADCSAGQYATAIATSGALSCAQPAFSQLSGAATDSQVPDNITITLAATATALAGDPADCSAGQYATTIAASGALTCAQVATSQLSGTVTNAQLANSYSGVGACGANTWASTLSANAAPTCTQPAFSSLSGAATDSQIPDNITISLAATAAALAADPADCSAGQYATTIAASGALTCAQPSFSQLSGAAIDSQVPDNITITLAATATALAADPADCSAGNYATAINASGTLTCAKPINFVETEVDFGTGDTNASIVVTGLTWVTVSSNITCAVSAAAPSAGRSEGEEDAVIEGLAVSWHTRVAGTGFTVIAAPREGVAAGKFKIHCQGS